MKNKSSLFFFLILLAALAFRLPGLSVRTMHSDEAVNAIKYGQLLSEGLFIYDAADYHGPSLYYLTIPFSIITAQYDIKDLSENTLRAVTLVFCLFLLLLLYWSRRILGYPEYIIAAALLAISPIYVFYSRYYIHEMLFVFFLYSSMSAFYHYLQIRTKLNASIVGFLLGMLVCTKETWIIYFLATVVTLASMLLIDKKFKKKLSTAITDIQMAEIFMMAGMFILTTVLLFSSFFQEMGGLKSALTAMASYIVKSENTLTHAHPWYSYFYWLFYSNGPDNLWGEAFIAFLAVSGSVFAFNDKFNNTTEHHTFYKFLTIYSAVCIAVFSSISYKTPWNALGFWFVVILLAGHGMSGIWQILKKGKAKFAVGVLLAAATTYLAWQSYYLNFQIYESAENAYTYAQPTAEIDSILITLDKISVLRPAGKNVHIDVMADASDYWPLPWYLRGYSQVGWWNYVDDNTPLPDIIIMDSLMEEKFVNKIFQNSRHGESRLYVPLFKEKLNLRPGKKLQLFVSYDIWKDI